MIPAVTRRLAIVRHGITDHNAGAIWQGHLDTALNATGQAQARAAARALATLRPAFVLSSDLTRARHTGQAIADACGLPLRTDERLREIHVGRWQGRSQREVAAEFPHLWTAITTGEDLARGGDGERVADVVRRARPAVDEAIEAIPESGLGLIVTHGVTARALVADLCGIDQSSAWTGLVGLRNCHWAMLEGSATGWRLGEWNAGVPQPAAPDLGSEAGSG